VAELKKSRTEAAARLVKYENNNKNVKRRKKSRCFISCSVDEQKEEAMGKKNKKAGSADVELWVPKKPKVCASNSSFVWVVEVLCKSHDILGRQASVTSRSRGEHTRLSFILFPDLFILLV
jgi:hypothetical protein